jgi:enamine deaminase RidA (YjgF/YER057c/UK114 family)
MRTCLVSAPLALLIGFLWPAPSAAAGVLVMDNHTTANIEFTICPPGGKEVRHTVAAGDLLPVVVNGEVKIRYLDFDGQLQHHTLQPDSVFYFLHREKPLELIRLAMPSVEWKNFAPAGPLPRRPGQPPAVAADAVYTIPVKILADDQEPRVQEVWEKRIRKRLAAASEIFEHTCHVRFEVVKVDSWVSDPKTFTFDKALADFEQQVRPAPARLAIGFTGRFQWVSGERHAGCTRTPLHPYILVRESLQGVSEAERLEFLVHELGHYLGAAHSADSGSVMRPKLADRQARARNFPIRFDAPNALVMNLFAENLRDHPTWGLYQLAPETRSPIASMYLLLFQATEGDEATLRNLKMMGVKPVLPPPPPSAPAVAAARDEAAKKAIAAAETWLALVDRGQYDESFNAAACYLRNVYGKDDFVKALDGARTPLGKIKSRQVKAMEYCTTLPDRRAPTSQYVLIHCDSSFANKKAAVETITAMLDKDGRWRVWGYYVK